MNFATTIAAIAAVAAFSGSAVAGVVYDGGSPNAFASGNEATYWIQTEDFTLGSASSITGANVYIAGYGGLGNWSGVVNYYVFADSSGNPGATLASGAGAGVVTTDTGNAWCCGGDAYQVTFNFASPFAAAAGTEYHFGIHLSNSFATRDDIYWVTTSSTASGTGIESAQGTENNWANNGQNHAFQLLGGAGGVPEPSTWSMLILGLGGLGVAARSRRRTVAA